jgi:small subunit ribosomal protein S17
MSNTETAKSMARVMTGVVVSNKMDKTVVVMIERRVKHPLYGKFMRRSTKVHAHDVENTCQMGDVVVVQECAPISKTKTWKLIEVKERAQ